MQLTDDQKKKVKQWVEEGCRLPEIQKRLQDEFNLSLTFMDVRFLIIDLGLALKEKPVPATARGIELNKAPGKESGRSLEPPAVAEEPATGGGVAVELDRVMKAGALVSGTVTFSDGVTASWSLDQFGRLGLNAGRAGYRPSQEDLQAFQQELTRLIQSRGM